MRLRTTVLGAAILAVAAAPTIPSLPRAADDLAGVAFDVEEDCFSLDPPAAVAVPLVDDTATVVPLHVRVLLDTAETPAIIALRAGDAADRQEAQERLDELVASAAPRLSGIVAAYEPLNIAVELSYDILTVWDERPSSTVELIQAGKDQYGGSTPEGVDVVYVATENLVEGTTAGQADCVGGLQSDHHSFAAGKMDRLDEPTDFFGVRMFANVDSGVFAHEVGHILGAHHHFMNCAESGPGYEGLDDALAVCTLMVNDIGLAQRTFSSVNSVVVRGFANEFAGD